MKILFSGNTFIGSNLRLSRLTKGIKRYKIMAFLDGSYCLPEIDYVTDAIKYNGSKFFKRETHQKMLPTPSCNIPNINLVIKELKAWEPDVIVSDLESISGHLAKLLNIPLVYVSPLYLSMKFDNEITHAYVKYFEHRRSIWELPRPDKKIIYSPFKLDMPSKEFEYIYSFNEPANTFISDDRVQNKYLEIRDALEPDSIFSTGETDIIADAINDNKMLYVMPKYKDPEAMLMAQIVNILGMGIDLGVHDSTNEYIRNSIETGLRSRRDVEMVTKSLADVL